MAKRPGRESDQFILRLPDGMRDRLKAAAAKNNRSMNAEIVARLEGTVERDGVGKFVLDISQGVWERIIDEAKLHDIGPAFLIEEALEKAFPPPTTDLGRIVQTLKRSLDKDESLDEEADQKARYFLEAAERLMEVYPDARHWGSGAQDLNITGGKKPKF